jgi:acetyl coenzyme A synthetase (ADP forming)-like protein
MPNLDVLLYPKSIAVIGASRSRTKLGRFILDNIIKGGFKGKVYPVNPKAQKIGSLSCFPSVTAIQASVDLGVIVVPVPVVLPIVKECCEKKVKSLIIITAGFSETGEAGFRLELQIKKMCEENGVTLLGPNCLGIISSHFNLNATFAKNKVLKGNIAFLSQSGALGTAALDWAFENNIGFSHFISIGNKTLISENDLIDYLLKDKKVEGIALYLEDFADGKGFMRITMKAQKPIVVFKPGRSAEAQKALGSHTGSLAQDDAVISAALKQSNVMRVETTEELFNVMKLISFKDKIKGKRCAIITNAGGPGVITTDFIKANNLELAKLSESTMKKLKSFLPEAANYKNPVDVLGDAGVDRYEFALKTVSQDKNVDAILVLLTPQVMTEIEKTALCITKMTQESDKVILSVFLGGVEVKKGLKILIKNKLPNYNYSYDAIKALSYLSGYNDAKNTPRTQLRLIGAINEYKEKVKKILESSDGVVDVSLAEKILKVYGIPILPSFFPVDMADARRHAEKLTYPIVLKLIHPELLHKSDVKAVKLDIQNQSDLTVAYTELSSLADKLGLEKYKIQMQHFMKGALELIIGVKRNEDQYTVLDGEKILRKKGFGHSIIFGMGGIYAEIYKDFSLRLAPLYMEDIDELFSETKVSRILSGARGKKYNIEKVKSVLASLSHLVADFPRIAELDINPVFAKGPDIWAADVKMIIKKN